jgi:hypothetical protein
MKRPGHHERSDMTAENPYASLLTEARPASERDDGLLPLHRQYLRQRRTLGRTWVVFSCFTGLVTLVMTLLVPGFGPHLYLAAFTISFAFLTVGWFVCGVASFFRTRPAVVAGLALNCLVIAVALSSVVRGIRNPPFEAVAFFVALHLPAILPAVMLPQIIRVLRWSKQFDDTP